MNAERRPWLGRKGFAVTGTLGVLVLAAEREMVDLEEAFGRLRGTNFHCSEELLEKLTIRERARRGKA